MGDKRELLLAVALLVVGFLVAPLVIDRVPVLASMGTIAKAVACFAFAIASFIVVVFAWAVLVRFGGRSDDSV